MIKCEICERIFKDRRGLGSHIRSKQHSIDWDDYQAKYTIVKLPEDKGKTGAEADETDEKSEPGDTHLAERIDRLENMFNTVFGGYTPTGRSSGITDFPGEEIEVIGEKINYKVALDPEIFSTYNKFKAICMKRGNIWENDFSDFLMMSVRTAMNYYGIYDMVVEMKGNKMLFEIPEGYR